MYSNLVYYVIVESDAEQTVSAPLNKKADKGEQEMTNEEMRELMMSRIDLYISLINSVNSPNKYKAKAVLDIALDAGLITDSEWHETWNRINKACALLTIVEKNGDRVRFTWREEKKE